MTVQAYRGHVFSFRRDPQGVSMADACDDWTDGLLVVRDGRITDVGPALELLPKLGPEVAVTDWRGKLILPGFIDTHLHVPQADIIASHGSQLLEWLNRYTFPAEARCADPAHARAVAEFTLDELLRNGTTTAMLFATVHAHAVDELFDAARARRMRIIAGKVLMDRMCPEELRDHVTSGYRDSAALIERWHGHGRLAYAVTPRFAPTSTSAQLASAGELLRRYPGVYMQTHLAENVDEMVWVRLLFPEARSYLDVYHSHGLLGERSMLAHCLHLDAEDRRVMVDTGSTVAFCPSSNLFLGSGLFDIQAADAAGMSLTLGSDVGGGTSYNMLRTMHEAYKVAQMRGVSLDPLRAYYWATLGAATALGLGRCIGRLAPGYEADFIVLDPYATPLLRWRTAWCQDVMELLFVLMILGDTPVVSATYVLGQRV